MNIKRLAHIKHGQEVVDVITKSKYVFLADISRVTGLSSKVLGTTLAKLLDHGHITKTKGLYHVP